MKRSLNEFKKNVCVCVGRNVVISDGNEYAIHILARLHHGFGCYLVFFSFARREFFLQKFHYMPRQFRSERVDLVDVTVDRRERKKTTKNTL